PPPPLRARWRPGGRGPSRGPHPLEHRRRVPPAGEGLGPHPDRHAYIRSPLVDPAEPAPSAKRPLPEPMTILLGFLLGVGFTLFAWWIFHRWVHSLHTWQDHLKPGDTVHVLSQTL